METATCSKVNVTTNGNLIANIITNEGTVTLSGDAELTIGNTFINYGTLDVSDWNGSGINNFVNYGIVIGDINKTLSSNSFDKQNGNNGILYPIPVQDVLNISLDKNTQGKVNVTVFDLTGKAVKAFEVLNNNFNINVSNLTQGMYLVKIVANNASLVKRIIKN